VTAGPKGRSRVVVTGLGVLSPLGDRVAALHDALMAGERAIAPVEAFDTEGLPCRLAAALGGFAPEPYLEGGNLRPLDRTGRLAAAAAGLALADAGWTAELLEEREVGLALGTMFGSVKTIAEFDRRALEAGPQYVKPFDFANSVINAAAGQAAIWHRLRGPNATVAGGTTAGLQALAYGRDLVATGRAPAVVAGGAEELCFESFLGFARAGALAANEEEAVPFHAERRGFLLGEGAALLVLEDEGTARERGATVHAEILGAATAFDPSRGRDPDKRAATCARAVRAALSEAGAAGRAPLEIDYLSTSASGSQAVDRAEARGLAEALGERGAKLPVMAVKASLGEALGASGALQTVALIEALRRGEMPGIAGLDRPEPGLPLALSSASVDLSARHGELRTGLVTSVGLDGAVSALVVGSVVGSVVGRKGASE